MTHGDRRGYVAPSIFLSSMFGTIRRHKNWVWYIIIVVIIISFVIYFNPSQRAGRDRGDAADKLPVINGKVITPKMLGDAKREIRLIYYLNNRKWPEEDHERAQQVDFDNEGYIRLFRLAKAQEAGIQISDETLAENVRRFLGEMKLDQFVK